MSPRVSEEHKEQRRSNILRAAKDVFIEHGYEKTTMKDIMDSANVSRGGLYQYFSNKEVVYETILEEALAESLEKTLDLLRGDIPSFWELLLASIFGPGGQPNDNMDPLAPSNIEFFMTGRGDERRRKYGKIRYYNAIKLYAEILEQGQKKGEFNDTFDPDIMSRAIITFMDGLSLEHSILPEEDVRVKEQAILFVEFLKRSLGVEGN